MIKKLALWGSLASIFAVLLAVFVFLTGKENVKDIVGIFTPNNNHSEVFNQFSEIKYEYTGILALFGSPSSAKALNGKRLVAEADVDFDGNLESGSFERIKEPGSLERIKVKETHYDIYGKVVYQGEIIFKASFGGYKVEHEDAIMGKKPLQVFTSWPISR